MSEDRREPRNQGYAKVIMDSRPGYLRNLTDDGCKIAMVSALPHAIGEQLAFQIIPDETSGLLRLTLDGTLCWEKKEALYFLYGFRIVSFASDAEAESYHKLVAQYGRS